MSAQLSDSSSGKRPARVVSVSPLTANLPDPPLRITGEGDGLPATQSGPNNAQELPTLMGRAESLLTELDTAVQAAEAGDAQARDAAACLQERLRVCARMLHAFQSQIVRIESAIADLRDERKNAELALQSDARRLDDQAAAFEQRLETALARFERQMDDARQDR